MDIPRREEYHRYQSHSGRRMFCGSSQSPGKPNGMHAWHSWLTQTWWQIIWQDGVSHQQPCTNSPSRFEHTGIVHSLQVLGPPDLHE